ncbi:3-hydroxyacyl-CoA dehydrogenase [Fonticula alba]|uniref:3-hydroxyacyl-CoA dehydrogenase n=1 Tax=Fonticula alba TaxID=691883 RepID=A0A058Z6J7_FONAL|nr:3-hydroxyacyl-CoA dehydrogenase [Fonticula alba]KCV69528.1 3-hydroxyacyl-CoA dehydrogenase [Fonticula alba]|eukprot:XP_009496093.1 3-hydroxyacyl-CoA dehydrogenase [Fonticula alba]
MIPALNRHLVNGTRAAAPTIASRLMAVRTMSSASDAPNTGGFQTVTIFGSGLMGSGIAQVVAAAGLKVNLIDTQPASLERAQKSITSSVQRVAKRQHAENPEAVASAVSDIMSRIHMSTEPDAAIREADLIIEAIAENLPAKLSLFQKADQLARPDAVFVSNTSSLSIAEMSQATSASRRAHFAGLHFFNPVPVMGLVEVIHTADTEPATLDRLRTLCKAIGKRPVSCRDTPGFIVNRLLVPYLFEAVRMLERGDASVPDIDASMKLGAGHPMGPFQLADYVGLDTIKFVVDGWSAKYPDVELFRPSELLNSLVAAGHLGVKTNQGFYSYENGQLVKGSEYKLSK